MDKGGPTICKVSLKWTHHSNPWALGGLLSIKVAYDVSHHSTDLLREISDYLAQLSALCRVSYEVPVTQVTNQGSVIQLTDGSVGLNLASSLPVLECGWRHYCQGYLVTMSFLFSKESELLGVQCRNLHFNKILHYYYIYYNLSLNQAACLPRTTCLHVLLY